MSPQGSTGGYCNLFRLDTIAESDLVQGGGRINADLSSQLGSVACGAGRFLDVG